MTEDESDRSTTTLGFTWSDGVSNGGLTIVNYRVKQKEQGGSYSVVATGLTTKAYTATGLTLATTYEFTVEA